MNNVIDIICRLLPNKLYVTVPKLDKDIKFIVTGISELDTDCPCVIVKKPKDLEVAFPNATYHVKSNLIENIIINNSKDDKN